jgi:hypothetical protein
MNPVPEQLDRQISLDLARDWAALGAVVRRRAAVMTAVDRYLSGVDQNADQPEVIPLHGEVPQ